jgi:hypothetical protein
MTFPRRWNTANLGFARLMMGLLGKGARYINDYPDELECANRLLARFRACYPADEIQGILRGFPNPLDRDLIMSLVTKVIYQSNDIRVLAHLGKEEPRGSYAASPLAQRAAMTGVQKVRALFPEGSSVHARHGACCDFVVMNGGRVIFHGEVKSVEVWNEGSKLKLGESEGATRFVNDPNSILAVVDKSNLVIYYYLNKDLIFSELMKEDSRKGISLHGVFSLASAATVRSPPLVARLEIGTAVLRIIEAINVHCTESLLPALDRDEDDDEYDDEYEDEEDEDEEYEDEEYQEGVVIIEEREAIEPRAVGVPLGSPPTRSSTHRQF